MVSEVTTVSSVPGPVSLLPLPVLCAFKMKPSTERILRWNVYFLLELLLENPNSDGSKHFTVVFIIHLH